MQTISDQMDPARAEAMHATLARSGPVPKAGDALPPFWHHIYFWHALPPADLGQDGHPKTGQGLIPDPGLPQRMWAGGQLEFHAPLLIGTPAQKHSTAGEVTHKSGRSGPLAFVTVTHEIRQGDRLCLTEKQDIVYRGPSTGSRTPPMAPTDPDLAEMRAFDTTLLFRYSALTFNGHRIHYDLTHATETEGYGGLVVHGPLLAQYLMHLAVAQLGPLTRFAFRAISPLIHTETARFCIKGNALWVSGPDGRLCMEATAG